MDLQAKDFVLISLWAMGRQYAQFHYTPVAGGDLLASALISKKHRTPYDWAAESMFVFSGKVFATW
ncbi:MAG: hypothetical protein ACWGN2_06055 [Anaerolineales bacterium]